MTPHSQSTEKLLSDFACDPKRGLTAEQVLAQREKFGRINCRKKRKKHGSADSLTSSRMS